MPHWKNSPQQTVIIQKNKNVIMSVCLSIGLSITIRNMLKFCFAFANAGGNVTVQTILQSMFSITDKWTYLCQYGHLQVACSSSSSSSSFLHYYDNNWHGIQDIGCPVCMKDISSTWAIPPTTSSNFTIRSWSRSSIKLCLCTRWLLELFI